MDEQLCVSQELGGEQCNCDSSFLEIRDFDEKKDFIQFLAHFWAFYKNTINEETAKYRIIDTQDGQIPVLECEARLYKYLHDGAKIKLAVDSNDVICGYLLYHVFWGQIVIVHHLWCFDNLRGNRTGKRLVESVGNVQCVLFQTFRDKPPEELLKLIKNSETIYESEKYKTWLMKREG